MKKLSKILFVTLLLTLPSAAFSQSQEEMAAWMEYMQPGQVHEMLAKWDGEWSGEMKMWTEPNSEPMSMDTKSVNSMILGGRYQYSVNTGNFMGMPFEGINILGYDNKRNVFQSAWIDNMGTGIMMMEGTWNDATKSCTMTGKMTDPVKGGLTDAKQVFTVIDDNTQKLEMYGYKDGVEYKSMEIIYKKSK